MTNYVEINTQELLDLCFLTTARFDVEMTDELKFKNVTIETITSDNFYKAKDVDSGFVFEVHNVKKITNLRPPLGYTENGQSKKIIPFTDKITGESLMSIEDKGSRGYPKAEVYLDNR